jgi:hypothetical protein
MTQNVREDFPFPTAARHDTSDPLLKPVEQEPSEDAIDQGIEESFPASDPVSVSVTKIERAADDDEGDKVDGSKTASI